MESQTRSLDAGTPDARVAQTGRRRSASADDAIIAATAALLVEVGYQGMCMETVATRAGVSKATLYRRHKDKQALVASMILETVGSPRDVPLPLGSTRQGLESMLRVAGVGMAQPSWLPILGAMLSERAREGGLVGVMRAQIFEPSTEIVVRLVEAGIARGELLPNASAEVIDDLLFGALLARSLHGKSVNDDWIERILSGILAGFGVPSAEPSARTGALATGERTPAAAPSWD